MRRVSKTRLLPLLVLVFLAGCWPAKKKEEVTKDDVVLASINNEPVMTVNKFMNLLNSFVGQVDKSLLPKPTQRKLFGNWLQIELGVRAAKQVGIDKDPEFVKIHKEQAEHLERELLFRFYDNKKFKEVRITNDEMVAHYDKNKALYVKEAGGPVVSGVMFKDRTKADNFYNKVRGKSTEEFSSVGKKETDGKFREFGRISAESRGYVFVPAKVKTSAMELTALPAVDLVVDNEDIWVISVSDRKEPMFFDFEDVQERIEKQIRMDKYMKMREELYKNLEKELNVVVNEDYFKEEVTPVTESPSATDNITNEPVGPDSE